MFREIVAFRRSPQFNDRFRYDLREVLRWRGAVRRFRTAPVPEALGGEVRRGGQDKTNITLEWEIQRVGLDG